MNVVNEKIISKAAWWTSTVKGIKIVPVIRLADIPDENLRENILLEDRVMKRDEKYHHSLNDKKTWYDTVDNALYVFLPNIANEVDLDRQLLGKISHLTGIAGILGRKEADIMGKEIFDNLYDNVQLELMAEISGNPHSDRDRSTAGKRYLAKAAESMTAGNNPDKLYRAQKHFTNLFLRYIQNHNRLLWDNLALDTTTKAGIFAAGIRGFLFAASERRQIAAEHISASSVRERILKLANAELENTPIDRGASFRLGMPSDVFLSSAVTPRTEPMELPLSSIFGDPQDDERSRFLKPSESPKRARHRFDLVDIQNLKSELDAPLAVFKSRDLKSPSTSVVMLHSTSMANDDSGNVCVPVTPKEVNSNFMYGRHTQKHSGRWVNQIDSVYPRPDFSYLVFLSNRSLVRYLEPGFEEKWFNPAVERIEKAYDAAFAALGEKKPVTREELDALRDSVPEYYGGDEKKYCPTPGLNRDRAGLLSGYLLYRDTLESATKVIKEFENPKIITQNRILFNISSNTDTLPGEKAVVEDIAERIRNAGVPVHVIPVDDPVLASVEAPDGRRVLGYSNGSDIFLSEDGATLETTIHEYTHVWAEAMRISEPETWAGIKEILKKEPEWEHIQSDPAYSHIRAEDDLASEVIARISGERNSRLIMGNPDSSVEDIADTIDDFWTWTNDEIFGKDNSFYDINELTDRVLFDLVKEKQISHADNNHKINSNAKIIMPDQENKAGIQPPIKTLFESVSDMIYDKLTGMLSTHWPDKIFVAIDPLSSAHRLVSSYDEAITDPVMHNWNVEEFKVYKDYYLTGVSADELKEKLDYYPKYPLIFEQIQKHEIELSAHRHRHELLHPLLRRDANLRVESQRGFDILESIYVKDLNMTGITPRSIDDIFKELDKQEKSATKSYIVSSDTESASRQIAKDFFTGELIDGDNIFIRDLKSKEIYLAVVQFDRMPNYKPGTKQVSEEFSGDKSIQVHIKYAEGSISAKLSADDKLTFAVAHNEAYYKTETYHFTEKGMLYAAEMKSGINPVYDFVTPATAYDRLCSDVKTAVKEMNYLELVGLEKCMKDVENSVWHYWKDIRITDGIPADVNCKLNDIKNEPGHLLDIISEEKQRAKEELISFIERGERTNNTLWDRITGNTFHPTHPLPDKEALSDLVVEQIRKDNISEVYYALFLESDRTMGEIMTPEGDPLNFLPEPTPKKEHAFTYGTVEGGAFYNMFHDLPHDADVQMELTSRIQGTCVNNFSGEATVIEKSPNGAYLYMLPGAIGEVLERQEYEPGITLIGDERYKITPEQRKGLMYGLGQWLEKEEGEGEREYVVFSIQEQGLVKAKPFDAVYRVRCVAKATEDRKAEALSRSQTNTVDQSRGMGGRK